MATPTYEFIDSTTLTSSASSVTFSSIPTDGTYRDLVLVIGMQTTGMQELNLRFNGDTGNNYSFVGSKGAGSTAAASSAIDQPYWIVPYNDSAVWDSILQIEFLDYATTDKHKTIIGRHDAGATVTRAVACTWGSTSAINTILITAFSGTYDAGSTFALYGIAG